MKSKTVTSYWVSVSTENNTFNVGNNLENIDDTGHPIFEDFDAAKDIFMRQVEEIKASEDSLRHIRNVAFGKTEFTIKFNDDLEEIDSEAVTHLLEEFENPDFRWAKS